jgi:hypothetical protein
MSEVFTDVLTQTAGRVKTRVDEALKDIARAEYGTKRWLRDVVGFWLDDVLGPWFTAVSSDTILLLTKNNRRSREVAATHPAKVVLTNLKRVGGGDEKEINAGNADFILKVTPTSPNVPTRKGTVAVEVFHALDDHVTAGEHYVGLLYEDQKLLAQVIFVALP